MAMAGYCDQCRGNVWLNADGSCPRGHGAEHITGAYEAGPPPHFVQQPAQPQAYQQPAQYPQRQPEYSAQTGRYPPQPGQPAAPGPKPERSGSHTGVVIAVIAVTLLGLNFLCGILAAIAIPALTGAKTDAGKRACFANQRTVYGASQAYLAEEGALPTSMEDLVNADLIQSEPLCPSSGEYAWDRTTGKITCSVHGSYESGGQEPPTQ